MSDKPKFTLGQLVATPGALAAMERAGQAPLDFLSRHVAGDWGDMSDGDKQLNDQALKDGSRIFSAYTTLKAEKLWVITEAVGGDGRRASTCILLPEEY